jgi:outer membrane protein with beta-barrel domain
MNKTTIIALSAALILASASTAQAQTSQTATPYHVNISVGGLLQSHEFSPVTTFELYNEIGTVTANQTIGGGFVFDISGGYRFWRNVSGAVGVSTFNGSGEAAAVAAIPDPVVIGRPTLKEFDPSAFGDLSQTNVAINFQAVWTRPINERIDLAVFGGPSIIHVSQDLPSVTPDPSANPTVISESGTGAGGNVGVDIAYRVNPRYRVGAFVRYLGGSVDLPAIDGLTVGGVEVAGGIRLRF